MSKEETVEVTIRVPKKLMDIIEAENYFNWKKDDFFVASIVRGMSCDVNDMDFDEAEAFHKKYGQPDTLHFDVLKHHKVVI